MSTYAQKSGEMLERIRKTKPVVHSITNYVVMNSTANVLLAMGASPIMAHALDEIEEIVTIAGSVVINIGTLSNTWIDSMAAAGKSAKEKGKPLVLDPVGAGATKLRTLTARNIINESPPSVIRGNASEILSLSMQEGKTRGVDSVHRAEDALEAARVIAKGTGGVVAVTGARDFVTDGEHSLVVSNGHPLLQYVTGTGCAASVVVGAFLSVEQDAALAAAAALAFFGLAAEKAASRSSSPGSFWTAVLDALYEIGPDELASDARIQES